MGNKKARANVQKAKASASTTPNGPASKSAEDIVNRVTVDGKPESNSASPPASIPSSSAAPTDAGSISPTQSEPSPSPEQEDPIKAAEKVKESGNVAFKAGRYGVAIDHYTEAIQLNPAEPAYLTNRAAAYMGLKRFRPALEDCQHAATLQSSSPSPKTLLRLARCQLALGSSIAASSAIKDILSIEPSNTQAIQLRDKVKTLEGHVKNFENARAKKEWGLARLALDKCLQAIEGEGGEIPEEWRIWRVELELARGNWEGANMAANDALRINSNSPDILVLRGRVLFLSGRLEQAKTHAQNALRLDPSCAPAQKLRKRVKEVERLKEEGNTAFKSGKLDEAVEKYTGALEQIGESEEEGKGGQIRATLLSNRATTLLKLSKHQEALTDTDNSLLLFPNSFKALRTRARIHLHLESYDASIADFKSAIQQAQTEGSATDNDVRALKVELKKAEAALKRSKTKDYYKILGVQRDCGDSDIKKAYRRESLKHHPDKASCLRTFSYGGDEEKFKLVVEAHAVLSDPQRRARYDMGEDEDGLSDGAGMGGGGGFNHVDLSELFAQFNGGGGGGGFGGGPFGGGGGYGGGGGGFNSFGGGGGAGAGGRRGGAGFHSHGFPF
ncbi:hypothetical protein D9756_002064 [Leucocoprinus leucothites]|uniref:J domain-containing protein n=1 Tax=Leucocoprinus leucothites TaxID=201217 RepID=A0A8H5GCB9_9AGAR|nr:hypothetical protein D9756_002064 [Leucoagaricus leucothites]